MVDGKRGLKFIKHVVMTNDPRLCLQKLTQKKVIITKKTCLTTTLFVSVPVITLTANVQLKLSIKYFKR
jgi:hypothetical protein